MKKHWIIMPALFGSLLAVILVTGICCGGLAQVGGRKVPKDLLVGVAGGAPFVMDSAAGEGISLEIWQQLAQQAGWNYRLRYFDDVPSALAELDSGKLDVLVGPVSITAERANHVWFTQPYFQSSLSILSRSDAPSLWQRIRPFFSRKFFLAVCVFILILGIVGTLLWMAERKRNPEQFPDDPARGVANGMWCAIVTMSTTGYGDKAPLTFWGRIIAGSWMVISLVFATTMVAGIASTLTLTGLSSGVIRSASGLGGKRVAVIRDSPAEDFINRYGATEVSMESLTQGYDLLKAGKVDAVMYDRPQLLYFLKMHPDDAVSVSETEYVRQGYGFALPIHSSLLHPMNLALLVMEERGDAERIERNWLGGDRKR